MTLNILDDKDSIRFGVFKCLQTYKVYTISSTLSTHPNSQPSYLDKAHKAVDTIKREDGVLKKMSRRELRTRFTNVEEIIPKLK